MSKTKRRTKNIDRQLHFFKIYWGEHLMLTWRGEMRYESLQAMYDAEIKERDKNIRRFHTDNMQLYYDSDKVKEFVRLRGARSAARQAIRKAYIEDSFDELVFNREDCIKKQASWWGC